MSGESSRDRIVSTWCARQNGERAGRKSPMTGTKRRRHRALGRGWMKSGWKGWVAAASVGLSLALGAGAASAQTVTEIIKRGKVRIGVLIGAPPYGMVDARGNPIGYDADVAAAIGKYMGVPIEMVGLTPPSRIPALEAGKVDFLVSTLAPTAERAKAVMFSIPYSAFQVGVFAKKDDPIKSWADLKGKKGGVKPGSSL